MTSVPSPDLLLADSAWLLALTRRLVGSAHADDLAQDVAIAALARPERHALPGRSWLAAVARNLAASLRRRQSAERRRAAFLPARVPVPSAAELATVAELQQKAVAAVLALPIDYRDTVLLRFLQGLSVPDTAEAMGVPVETVRTRQRRALAMLRAQLASPRERRFGAGLAAALTAWSTAMKAQSVVAAAGVVLLSLLIGSLCWQATATADPAPPSPSAIAATGTLSTDGNEGAAVAGAPMRNESARTIVVEPPPPSVTTGAIRVRVVWQDTRVAAPGMAVLCRITDRPGTFATTDRAGEVEFGSLEPGRYHVQLHDWTGESVIVEAGEERAVELALAHTLAATGIVLDANDRPVAGARILVSSGGVQPQWSFPAAESDARGRFDVAGLRTYALVGAHHPQHGTSDYRMLQGDPPNGSAHAVTLRLPGLQSSLRGLVTDARGRAIVGAWVGIGEYHGRMRADADGNLYQPPPASICTTDGEGHFLATGLWPGERQLAIYRKGFAPHHGTVTLKDGEEAAVAIVLWPGAALTGSVRNARGEPVANATIEAGSARHPAPGSAETDAHGHFRLDDLEPGETSFEVVARDHARQRQTFVLESGIEQQWHVVLAAPAGVRGRLLDENGGALVGWWVGVRPANRRSKTDAEGRFVLPDASDAGNTLLVRDRPGFAPVRARFDNVPAVASERTFVIGPEHAVTAGLRGRLLDGDGAPLAGVAIGIEQEGWPVVLADAMASRADGTFEIGPLPPGTYEVTPAPGRWVFEPVTAVLERDAMRELGTLRGALPAQLTVELTGDAAQVARARVTLVAGERRIEARGQGATRTFERLFPRSYELIVQVDGRDWHRAEISIAPGAESVRTVP